MRSARFPASSQAASFIVAATRGAFRSREIWQLRIVSASAQNSSKVHLLLLAGCFFDNPPETTTQVKYLRRDHLFEVRANSAQPRTFVCGNPMRPDGQLDKNPASNWDALQFNRSIRFADRNNSRSETRRRDVYSRVYSRARARVPGRDDLGAAESFKPATRGISDPFNQDANVRFFERHTRDRNACLQDSALAHCSPGCCWTFVGDPAISPDIDGTDPLSVGRNARRAEAREQLPASHPWR